ncbi:stringent starvation protein B [Babesia caballi]|uniref:Stringent starvation protein B n=1 Tax=Babesia caballi TaxID=5871 RepID=A0AAV4LWT1_BABCB|nr:stringent starvation protein B [Babesia caballi]
MFPLQSPPGTAQSFTGDLKLRRSHSFTVSSQRLKSMLSSKDATQLTPDMWASMHAAPGHCHALARRVYVERADGAVDGARGEEVELLGVGTDAGDGGSVAASLASVEEVHVALRGVHQVVAGVAVEGDHSAACGGHHGVVVVDGHTSDALVQLLGPQRAAAAAHPLEEVDTPQLAVGGAVEQPGASQAAGEGGGAERWKPRILVQ